MGEGVASAFQNALLAQQQALEAQQHVGASLQTVVIRLSNACASVPVDPVACALRTQVVEQVQVLLQLQAMQQMACQMQAGAIEEEHRAQSLVHQLVPSVPATGMPSSSPIMLATSPPLPQPLQVQPTQMPPPSLQQSPRGQPKNQPESESAQSGGQPKSQQLQDPARWKTVLCKTFATPAGCRFGEQCNFAHGAEELRPKGSSLAGGTLGSDVVASLLAFDPGPGYGAEYNLGYGVACGADGMLGPVCPILGSSASASSMPIGSLHAPPIYLPLGGIPMTYAGNHSSYVHDPPLKRQANGQAKTQLLQDPARWKTQLCKLFDSPAGCRFGAQCNFAHGGEELRLKGS